MTSNASDKAQRDPPLPAAGASPWRGRILRALTGVQNTSAIVFSTFLGLHLAAPLAASVGGLALADKTMLVAREVYIPLEPLLIWAPLLLHLSTSTLKRGYITYLTRRAPVPSIHLITGWALVPFLLSHILSHRLVPASPAPPIAAAWPSEWGFDFVGHALQSHVWSSGAAYLALVGLAVPHAVLGAMKVVSWIRRVRGVAPAQAQAPAPAAQRGAAEKAAQQTPSSSLESPRRKVPAKRKITAGWLLVGLLNIVAIGLVRIYRDGRVSRLMAKRYDAVLQQTAWSRLYIP